MGLLLSRQRTHQQHHQHDAELLSTLKQIEHQLETLVREQRQFYEESVQRDQAARERTDVWIATQTQWRENDIEWRDAEQARVWQLAEEAKTHARYISELATQQERSTTLPYGFSDDAIAPPPSKRRRVKTATSEQAAPTPSALSDEPTETDAPPPATEPAQTGEA